MAKRARILLLSLVSVMMCLAMMTMGTYALLTDQENLYTHLQAGDIDITLSRTALEYDVWRNNEWASETAADQEEKFFTGTNTTTENVFGIKAGDLIAPMSNFKATMKVQNNSTIGFVYWVEIVSKDATAVELHEQLEVTVIATDVNGNQIEYGPDAVNGNATLESGLLVGSAGAPVGSVNVGESSTFQVIVEFIDDAANNDAAGQEVHFDLVVYAVQFTPTQP